VVHVESVAGLLASAPRQTPTPVGYRAHGIVGFANQGHLTEKVMDITDDLIATWSR
jgi:hypothetical protein